MRDRRSLGDRFRGTGDRIKWTLLVFLMFGLLAFVLVSFLGFLFFWFVVPLAVLNGP
ncbi:hypothetical protein [Streptomyces sp. NPDC002553]|uniref:hypothetical protein n=1 Tax=unclassified Streptomyces TaxID=2593676 RepID=UPI003330FEE4